MKTEVVVSWNPPQELLVAVSLASGHELKTWEHIYEDEAMARDAATRATATLGLIFKEYGFDPDLVKIDVKVFKYD